MWRAEKWTYFRYIPYQLFETTIQRALISVLVFTVLLILGLRVFVYPQQQKYEQLQIKTAQTHEQIRLAKQAKINQQNSETLQAHLQKVLNAFYQQTPSYVVTTDFIAQLERWSKGQQVNIDKVNLGILVKEKYSASQSLDLQFSGNYQQLMSLFDFLAKRFALVEIVQLKLSRKYKLNSLDFQSTLLSEKLGAQSNRTVINTLTLQLTLNLTLLIKEEH